MLLRLGRPAAPGIFNLSRSLSSKTISPYHSLFNLPDHPNPFVVDAITLKRNFLKAQRLAHPDAWSGKGQKAVDEAGTQSAHINKAYETLLSPLKRAEYLLSLRGLEIGETAKLEGNVDGQQDFIIEVMEAREELEEARSEEEIAEVRRRNKDRINLEVQAIEEAFAREDYDSALKSSIRLRYWEGIESAAKEKA